MEKFKNFQEVEKYIIDKKIVKKIALCGAHDEEALAAVVHAKQKGYIQGILIGDEEKIKEQLRVMNEPENEYEIINAPTARESSEMALKLVREGEADIEMKGLMPSTEFLLPIMHPITGMLPLGNVFSAATAFYNPDRDDMMFVADCAVNISPDLEQKEKIIRDTVNLARAFGFDEVRVAAVSATADINPNIPSTVDAQKLSEMDFGEKVHVEGPLPLDCVFDRTIAEHKGVGGEVAGRADVLLMPDLCSGNVLHKSIHYLAHLDTGAILQGSKKPVVFTSRSDSADGKQNSILIAILQSIALEEKENG